MSNVRVTIRRARRADSARFIRLLLGLARFERLNPPNREARKRIIKDVFVRKRVKLLLALRFGKPVGYGLYFFTYSSFLAKPTLYLEDIFVSSEYRRMGIGRSLFLWCVNEAIRRGCGRMEWSVLNWNSKAVHFYGKMGARKLEEWSAFRLDSKNLSRLGSSMP